MNFVWGDYLTVAEALVQQRGSLAPEEACCRAAISRAYYEEHAPLSTTTEMDDQAVYAWTQEE
jgi:hypothetical protein